MFGSQILDTAIGLVLMFFVISLAASTIVEVYARLLSKRAKNLEAVLGSMLAGSGTDDSVEEKSLGQEVKARFTKAGRKQAADETQKHAKDVHKALVAFKGTSIYDGVRVASGKTLFGKKWKKPSYLSAKTFAAAISELTIDKDGKVEIFSELPEGLQNRLASILTEVRGDALELKAGLEHWFDSTMQRLEGAYKRWTSTVLFVVGLLIAVVANAGVYDVAESLWQDTATREAVVESAVRTTQEGESSGAESIDAAVDQLQSLQLPIGWDAETRAAWTGGDRWPWGWSFEKGQFVMALGWTTTAFMVILGATFWFDVLTKLVSLRSSGAKPKTAVNDPESASAELASRKAASISGSVDSTKTDSHRGVETSEPPDSSDAVSDLRDAVRAEPVPRTTVLGNQLADALNAERR